MKKTDPLKIKIAKPGKSLKKNKPIKGKEDHRNIEVLSKTAIQFVEFPRDRNIYTFVGEQLRELTGKNSYIIINTYDENTSTSTTRTVLGLGEFTDKITKLLGRHPIGMTLTTEKENHLFFPDGNIHYYKKGLYGILLGTVPKTICNSIEKLLKIKNILIIDLANKKKAFGTVIILLKENVGEINNKLIIETFIKQASIAIQKRQIEEAIDESDIRYKKLYTMLRLMSDNLPDLIWAKDMEGKFIFVNKACSKILLDAKDTDEPIGKTDIYFTQRGINSHPENPDYFTFGNICTKSDQIVLDTKKPLRFDESGNVRGKLLYLDVYKAPFEDENGNLMGTVGSARVATKERHQEMETHLLQKLTMAISESPDFETALNTTLSLTCEHTGWIMGEVLIPNQNKTALEYCLGYCNENKEHYERLRHFIEYSKQFTFPRGIGLPGRVWSSMKPEWQDDVSSLTEKVYLRAKLSKKAGIRAALGVPIINNNQVLTVLVFYMIRSQPEDEQQIKLVSAVVAQLGTLFLRKKAEEALQKSEEKFRLIAENTSDVISLHTFDLKASYTYISPSVINVSGYEPEELLGKSSFFFIHPQDRKKLIPLLKKYIGYKLKNLVDGKESTYNETIVFRSKHKSGKWIYVQSIGNIIGDQLLFVTRDITEQKQVEEELNKYRDHLEEMVKERTAELEEKNAELERFNKLFVDREFRIKELRDKVKKLENK